MSDLGIETHRSGIFTFRIGADPESGRPLVDKLEYGHRLFVSMPLLPEIISRVEKETLVASIHGTDTIEGGDLSEEEISGAIEGANRAPFWRLTMARIDILAISWWAIPT